MSRQDVRRALEAMDEDEEVQARFAAGDFEAVAGLELTDDERLLVQDAASDLPEVAGFAADIFAKLGDIKGESIDSKHKGEIELLGRSPHKWQSAVRYGWNLRS